ncbi:DUF4199 domain-containing protein [Dyadobacter luticola]|uniref:DUF4199 domain-containing protein n=1 Tax=Dyadobacter luticola TaxID=1979387 RepID=A0A5R9KWL7_9BACT|nr:DUF4199 domain-containing protein [Dyadobacter luticola]TLV00663.1 DUF4199 domain-containing protein [Dyadobacter luticola]
MEEKVSTARFALKYGALGAVVIMIYTTILNVAGLAQNRMLGFLSFVFMIVAIVLALKEFKEENKGFLSYGEGLGLGSLLSAVMGLLTSAFTMFYTQFIDNTIMAQTLDKMREELERQGKSDSEIDTAMELSQKFMSPGILFVFGVFSYLIFGFILSLVIAAIMRREKPVFD